MNISDSDSSQPQPSGLQVELGSKPKGRFKAIRLVPLAVLLAVGSATLLAWLPKATPDLLIPSQNPSLQRTSSTQPKITWSENQLEVILSPGESISRQLTFTSSLALRNVVIEAVPKLAPFVSIQPNSLANLPAGQSQTVSVLFSIPPGATLGTHDGTIQVRAGSQTLPQTLKVIMRLVNPLGVSIGDLAGESQIILVGDVVSIRPELTNGQILTYVTIAPSNVFKGMPSTDLLVLGVPGGTVGGFSSLIPGSPQFAAGETVVLFLNGPDATGQFTVAQEALGTFHVQTDPTLGNIAVIDAAYKEMESIRLREPEFRALITASEQKVLRLDELLSAMGIISQ